MADDNTGSMARNNNWTAILEERVKLGEEWRDRLSDHEELAKDGRYIRIRGRDFRAISVNPKNPCGRLLDASGSEIKKSRDIDRAIASAKASSPDKEYKPGNEKTEMTIQAFLIREALLNNLSFYHLFEKFDEKFDELFFVTDEMRFGDGKVKPDIIAVGRHSGKFFPVLIELKVDKKLKKLEEQLNNAKNILDKDKKIQELFIKFLCAVAKADSIDYSRTLRLLIWPRSESGNEAPKVAKARDRGILMAQYSCNNGKYSFALDDPSQQMRKE